jgi:hypothetical protein
MRKTCSKCKTIKEFTEFNKHKNTKDGHRSECRECEKEYKKLYRENNKEKVSESNKLYRENNKEKIKLYRENNKEKEAERKKLYYENNKESEKERCKLWRENNKEKLLLQHARRRASKKNLPFSIVEEDITIPDVCPVLGIPLFSGDGHMIDNSPNLDRIIPEKGYVAGNIRVISQRANRIKSNATVEELRAVLKDLQKQLMILESEIQYET